MRPLRVKIAMYRYRGLLECQVSRPNAQVKWYKNRKELLPSKKYQLISQDIYRQLTIDDVCSSDEDTYTCDAGDDKTSCQLLVEGEISPVSVITSIKMLDLWPTVCFAVIQSRFQNLKKKMHYEECLCACISNYFKSKVFFLML